MNRRRFFGDNAEYFPLSDPLRLMGKRPHINLAPNPALGIALINGLDSVKTKAVDPLRIELSTVEIASISLRLIASN